MFILFDTNFLFRNYYDIQKLIKNKNIHLKTIWESNIYKKE
jgi:hypothetical protein